MLSPIPDRETMLAISDIVHQEGALLIYDEVVSGFRVAIGGVQEIWGVIPDLACYGKAIANGLPLSVLVGRECWMRNVSSINYNLTYATEAVSIVAAIETINEIVERKVCEDLAYKGRILKSAYSEICEAYGIHSELVGHDCRPQLEFQDHGQFSSGYCHYLVIQELARQRICTYGTFSICYAHTLEDIEIVIDALDKALEKLSTTIHHHKCQVTSAHKEFLKVTQESFQQQYEYFKGRCKSLQERNKSLQERNKSLQHQYHTLCDNNNSLQQQYQCLCDQNKFLQQQVAAMESSKFWKLRTLWFRFKHFLSSMKPII
jgi:flagellar capping protein FliD